MAHRETSVPAGFEFWSAQLERLGERDPLEVLAETPDALEGLMGGRALEDLSTAPAPGKWSPLEILGHLGDTEWIFGLTPTAWPDRAVARPRLEGRTPRPNHGGSRLGERDLVTACGSCAYV